jgi:MFS family permease
MIGAIVFGHFGDRLGRNSMLLISLLTMATARNAGASDAAEPAVLARIATGEPLDSILAV